MTLSTVKSGVLAAQATDKVRITYDRQFNLISIEESGKVIHSAITPEKFTLNQFYDYLVKVQRIFLQN